MFVRCNETYVDGCMRGFSGLELQAGELYPCTAHSVVNDDARLLIGGFYRPKWLEARYLDDAYPGRPWPLSAQWGVLSDHFGDRWSRLLMAPRQLLPLADQLQDGLGIDEEIIIDVEEAFRRETARDELILNLYRAADGKVGWSRFATWAQETLEETSPKAIPVFSDEQVVVLAEISAMTDAPDDVEAFVGCAVTRI